MSSSIYLVDGERDREEGIPPFYALCPISYTHQFLHITFVKISFMALPRSLGNKVPDWRASFHRQFCTLEGVHQSLSADLPTQVMDYLELSVSLIVPYL